MERKVYAVVLAAGSGLRARQGINKMLKEIRGQTPLDMTLSRFRRVDRIDKVFVTCKKEEEKEITCIARHYFEDCDVVIGGETRQESVYNALCAIDDMEAVVLIHDGARSFVSEELINDCIDTALEYGTGVAGKISTDTVKKVGEDGQFVETLNRNEICLTETPQSFIVKDIKKAHEEAIKDGYTGTDDASLLERLGIPVKMVISKENNKKLTFKKDFEELEDENLDIMKRIRIGQGYDIHLLREGRKLIIGGVEIPYEKGLLGHSDADVLLHAVTDSILGAAGLGDIGEHFPDTDDRYKDIDSSILLKEVRDDVYKKGFRIINLDITVFLEEPKMKDYKRKIVSRIAEILEIDSSQVNLKAKTMEKTGAIGRKEAIGASATCLMRII